MVDRRFPLGNHGSNFSKNDLPFSFVRANVSANEFLPLNTEGSIPAPHNSPCALLAHLNHRIPTLLGSQIAVKRRLITAMVLLTCPVAQIDRRTGWREEVQKSVGKKFRGRQFQVSKGSRETEKRASNGRRKEGKLKEKLKGKSDSFVRG
jgi:hypothetical protein